MRIAIVGVGQVGRTLGRAWSRLGHGITYVSRDPLRLDRRAILEGHPGQADVAGLDGVHAVDLVALTVPGHAAPAAAASLGLDGQVLIDVTNPLVDGATGLAPAGSWSGGEAVAAAAPKARVVKAFNTIGVAVMAAPGFPGGRAALPVCSDHAAATAIVVGLADSMGFEAFDAGPLRHARWTEGHAMLWIRLAMGMGWGPDFAFARLQRPPGEAVTEIIRYRLRDPARAPAFLAAWASACGPLRRSAHHLASSIVASIDDPAVFVVHITWRSQADHLEGFRSSAEFREFLPHVRPFIEEIEEMAHYRTAKLPN